MKKTIYILLVLLSHTAYSQSISFFNIDASNFPTIKAKFIAFDSTGFQITNLNPSDFEVKENGQPRTVTYVSCPEPMPIQNVSIAMSIDVSGSMRGGLSGEIPVELGKTTARELCKSVPIPPSEFALQTCDSKALIIQDFTTDKSKLLSKIDPINAHGDNDFVEHLLNNLTGLLNIAKNGKYKRVAVLYTDAWWYALNDNELQDCKDTCSKYNIQFFAVIYSRPEAEPNGIKKSLQLLADATGGYLYDGVTSTVVAKDIANRLQLQAQGGDPCQIEWHSGFSCVSAMTNVEVKLFPNNLTSNTSYQSPNTAIAKLEIVPPTLKFKNVIPGIKRDTTIIVTAKNADFNVTNITSSNPAFTVTPTSFLLINGQSQNLTVSYISADSGYTYTKFTIENDKCTTKYYASGGYPGKKAKIKTLKLIQPNGGETFVVGMDTFITWEGVLPEEKVKIEYTTDNGANWLSITNSATGLEYNWTIPKTPSNLCLARVTAKLGYATSELDSMVLIPAGTFQMGNTGVYSGNSKEKPVHEVTITKAFLLGKYEVAQKLYESVTNTNPSNYKGENLPVETVSWYDAVEFCNKLSEQEDLEACYSGSGANISCNFNANGYRLPTEAEWEYACKAGSTTDFYNGSLTNDICLPIDATLDIIGWYCGNSGNQTHDVGQKEPNIFGLYDMSGNVWEWCWDWYGGYTNTSVSDPKGANSGLYGLLRGGSWSVNADNCRCSHRRSLGRYNKSDIYGFRLCRTL